jgi:two-component system, OmpR family, sensor kinase
MSPTIPTKRRNLGIRITLLFALVYLVVVLLTDTLVYFNFRASEINRGFGELQADARFLASVFESMGEAQFISLVKEIDGEFDAVLFWSDDGMQILAGSISAKDAAVLTSERGLPVTNESRVGYLRFPGATRGNDEFWIAGVPTEYGRLELITRLANRHERIRSFGLQLFVLSAMIAFIGFWVMILLGASVTRPILMLTTTAAAIAAGDLSSRVGLSRADEIGSLAETFDDMAERIESTERGRREFISDVSHELKTPLASIKAVIEALVSAPDTPSEIRSYLSAVNREVNRMSGLVTSLVTCTRLDELKPFPVPMAVRRTAERIARLVGPRAQEQFSTIRISCPEELVIIADSQMIDELLLNLLDNAIRHGSPRSLIDIGGSLDPPSFWVENEGPTIHPDQLSRVFEPFYTGDTTRNRNLSGSGLGLAIVTRIAAAHKFEVIAESQKGRTRFSIFTNN